LPGALNSIITQRSNDMSTRGRSPQHWQRVFVMIAMAVAGGFLLIFGVWSLLFPRSFDALIDFPPYNEHLLHDVGAFQIGIGVSLLLSVIWSDSIGVALVAFIVAGMIHSINHAVDRHLGGHLSDQWALGGLVLLAVAALIIHLRGDRKETNPRRYRRA
jgi:uncharacterized membrane protein YjjP (DUF1212 family)